MSEQVAKGADEKFCSTCGAVIKIAAEICPKCGVRQTATTTSGDPNASDKSRVAALLLCFFLGGFGAHRFYTGKVGTGILQLFTLVIGWVLSIILVGYIPLFILGVWVFIDFIVILVGSFRDNEGKQISKW